MNSLGQTFEAFYLFKWANDHLMSISNYTFLSLICIFVGNFNGQILLEEACGRKPISIKKSKDEWQSHLELAFALKKNQWFLVACQF